METDTDKRKEWRDFISEKIASGAVDAALLAITKGWSLFNRGPIKWITERLLEYIWDKTADQAIRWFMRKAWLAVDMRNGAILVKKINKAKDENNRDDYWRSISNI